VLLGMVTVMQPFFELPYVPGRMAAQTATAASSSRMAATTAAIRRLSRLVACSAAGWLANGITRSIRPAVRELGWHVGGDRPNGQSVAGPVSERRRACAGVHASFAPSDVRARLLSGIDAWLA